MSHYEKLSSVEYSNLSLNLLSIMERKLFEETDALFINVPNYQGLVAYMKVRFSSLKHEFSNGNLLPNTVGIVHIHPKRKVKSSKSPEQRELITDVTLGTV